MTQPIRESISRNTSFLCKAESCNNYRYNLSGYCTKHCKNFNLYGNPHGKALRQSTYLKELQEASKIINDNLDHVSTKTALAFIQSWIDKSMNGSPCVCATEVSRLAYSNVTAIQILIESSAIFIYSQRHPNSLKDGNELTYQIGIGILRLAPQVTYRTTGGKKGRRKANGTERKSIGKYLRESLGLYMYNVFNTINRKEQLDLEFRQSLYTPLEIPKSSTKDKPSEASHV
jgi:hypothetical protein